MKGGTKQFIKTTQNQDIYGVKKIKLDVG